MTAVIARTPADYETFRTTPDVRALQSVIADPVRDKVPFMAMLEILEPGAGMTAQSHAAAYALIYVVDGTGVAEIGARTVPLRAADSFCVLPGDTYRVESTGPGKLYCLSVLIPEDGFPQTVRSGERSILSAEDLAVLQRRVLESIVPKA